jgi:RNA polymerase sigma factor (sigma-70 family)
VNAQSDSQLLRAFAERRSEAAFAELVRRHIDLVHSAAFRMVNDPHLAKDVSQGVFVALVKDAGKLTNYPVLSGWLHRTARNIAAQTVRTDARRRKREHQAAAMNEFPETDAPWEEIAPHLDAALAELNEPDRDAVLLRYFENKPAQEMAAILGISAEAAQKRVSRAVERLRENFAKRGITAGAGGLAGIISANAVQTAPAGMAVTISATALAGPAASTAITTVKATSTAFTGKALAAAAMTLLAGAWIYQFTRSAASPAGMAMPQPPPATTQKPRPAQGKSLIENIARTWSEKPPVDRKKELERLKQRWLELKPRGNAGVPEQEALAKESAKILLSGTEAVELLRFLKKNEFWGESTLEREIAGVFDTSQADEARAMLLEIADTKTWVDLRGYKTGGDSYRETWSKAAGKSCPDEEFDSFCLALNSSSCAQEALFGRNERLLGTDPVAALASTLESLEADVPSDSRTGSLLHLFEQNLPPGVNFENLEKLLPPGNRQAEKGSWQHSGDPVSGGREKLFEKWAKVDSIAAADYVVANPDRCPPKLIQTISKTLNLNDPAIATKWVEHFPAGPHFDAAADEAVWNLAMDHPDEALRLASRISDPKVKERALQRVDKHQAIKRGEASFEDGR